MLHLAVGASCLIQINYIDCGVASSEQVPIQTDEAPVPQTATRKIPVQNGNCIL